MKNIFKQLEEVQIEKEEVDVMINLCELFKRKYRGIIPGYEKAIKETVEHLPLCQDPERCAMNEDYLIKLQNRKAESDDQMERIKSLHSKLRKFHQIF